MYSILLTEGDKQFRSFLKQLLLLNKYSLQVILKPKGLLMKLQKKQPDLLIIDGKLFGQQTENICKEARKYYPSMKILVMGTRPLKCRADDYISKPFTPEVFLAKVKAQLELSTPKTNLLKYEELTLDHSNFQAIREGRRIDLTPKEYALLLYMMTNPNHVLTREMILHRVWTYAPNTETRVVDIFISFLREKIDKSYKRKYIKSVRGFGYKFE